jgi:[acyl-carrier-protein] S-malonyltransferase
LILLCMNKLAFIFPGVGPQYAGMGGYFYRTYPLFKEIVEEASDAINTDMAKLCLGSTADGEFNQLINAQCALLTVSYGISQVAIRILGIEPAYCLGHSLGEYPALCAAGILPFATGVRLVKLRGEIISDVISRLDGTMVWVINIEAGTVEKICRRLRREGKKVYVSAIDAPRQTSISGPRATVMETARLLEKEGAIVYPLQLSGPFHCPLMKEAGYLMKKELERHSYSIGKYPVIANDNAQCYTGPDSVASHLARQLHYPVQWQESIRKLTDLGVSNAVEMGPGEVLTFLMPRNTNRIRCLPSGTEKHFTQLKKELVLPQTEYTKAIGKCMGLAVSTPNKNHRYEAYEINVNKPFQRLKELYLHGILEGGAITDQDMADALSQFQTILKAKQLPDHLQEEKIALALQHHITPTP